MEKQMTDELLAFFSRVRVDENTDCWNWTGNLQKGSGLPRFSYAGSFSGFATRFIWEKKHGKLPGRIILNRDCKNTSCVNPNHASINQIRMSLNDPATIEHANKLLAQI